MEVNGKTAVCGLIGCPVAHTLSPVIHNRLSELTGKNLVYVPFPVEEGQVGQAVSGAWALGICGLNVTVPHKSTVIPYLTGTDTLAGRIGAVNTLVRAADGYFGYNTDMPGLLRALQSEGIALRDEELVILGAGGAARAVAYLAASENAGRVYILNRTPAKAEAIAAEVNQSFGKETVIPMLITDYPKLSGRKYLVIQATSVGLAPKDQDVVIEDASFYQMVSYGFDLIYRPAQTRFMKLAVEAGAPVCNGLKMLLYQGIIAYELWNDIHVTQEQAELVYQAVCESM